MEIRVVQAYFATIWPSDITLTLEPMHANRYDPVLWLYNRHIWHRRV
jgi:hypothetical protein